MYPEDKKDQVVMWILLIIILSNPPIKIVHSNVLGIYQDKQTCEKHMERALSSNPPQNTNVGCIKLKGVKQTNG